MGQLPTRAHLCVEYLSQNSERVDIQKIVRLLKIQNVSDVIKSDRIIVNESQKIFLPNFV